MAGAPVDPRSVRFRRGTDCLQQRRTPRRRVVAGDPSVTDALAQTGRGDRVLVIGDSRRVDRTVTALEEILRSSELSTAPEIDAADEQVGSASCIVCDVESIPSRNPIESLRERAPDVPVIAIAEDGAEEIGAGATDVLSPSAPSAVVAARVRNLRSGGPNAAVTERGADWYRSVLDAGRVAVLVLDVDGRIRWASRAVDDVLQTPPELLERDPIHRYVHPDDRESVLDGLEQVAAAGADAVERIDCRFRHGDDAWRRHELVLTNRLADPSVDGVVCTVTPVTDGSTDRSKTLVDDIDDPVFAVGPEWELTAANPRARELLSPRVDGLHGVVLWELLPETTASTWYERLSEARASASPVEFEVEAPSRAGWLSVRAYPTEESVAVVASERTQPTSERHRERLDLLESLLDASDDPAFVVEDGHIVAANAATFDRTGADVVVGHSVRSVFPDTVASAILERADSRVRRLDPIEWTVESGSTVELLVVSLSDGRAACVGRDVTDRRLLEETVNSLSATAKSLVDAATVGDVRQFAVDAVESLLGTDLAVWYQLDWPTLSPEAHSSTDRSIEPRSFEWDPRHRSELDPGRPSIATGIGRLTLADGLSVDRPLIVPIDDQNLVIAEYTDRVSDVERASTTLVARLAKLALLAADTERDRRRLERDLASRRDELEAVTGLLDRRRAIDRRLLVEPSRPSAELGVCEELQSKDGISLVVIADSTGGESVEVRALAGDDRYLSTLVDGTDPSEPTLRALDRGTDEFVASIVGGDRWRSAARDAGFRSVVATPIEADDLSYGVLGVYASSPAVLDERTRAFVSDVGNSLALTIEGHEARRALLADDIVELELSLGSTDEELLTTLARRMDREIQLETVVPGDERTTLYLAVSDSGSDRSIDALEGIERVEIVHRLPAEDDQLRLEVGTSDETLASVVADIGGVLRTITADEGTARAVIELPADRNVRSFLTTLRDRFPDASLLARRSRRGHDSHVDGGDLHTVLTDRQLEVLRTAHAAGYFEWPRERTGEEIAEILDVSQPTFTRHFRSAERTVFDRLFDGDR